MRVGGVADVWSISGGCDSGTRPADVSPDGTSGGGTAATLYHYVTHVVRMF